jgi:hypothetical protein
MLRVFENGVLRGIFGARSDEITGSGEKLHNEELHDLYSSPTTARVIKSRRIRWACAGFWWGNLSKGDHWGDPGVDGRIILRWTFRTQCIIR